jgi:hypothetical protein
MEKDGYSAVYGQLTSFGKIAKVSLTGTNGGAFYRRMINGNR